MRKRLFGISGIILVMALVAVVGTSYAQPTNRASGGAKSEPIVFSDLNWDTAQLQTEIAMFIVSNGYHYPVDKLSGDALDALREGDAQVAMEVWLPNQQAAWEQAIVDSSIVPLGKSLDDNWQSSFVVPTYFAEEHGLQTVEDLLSDEHWELFVGVATDLPPAPDEIGRFEVVPKN